MLLYSLGLLTAIVLASPYWLFRMLWSGRYHDGLAQRLGAVPRSLRDFVAGRPPIWIHAVSVGEVMAASRLVELFDGIGSESSVVISTTTRTGQRMAQERFDSSQRTGGAPLPSMPVFYYPLDFRWIVCRYLRVLRPRVLVLVESELWPRMLMEAHRAKVPVVVVNGRISDRSLPRYRALRSFWRPFLRRLTLVMAQTEQDRERFIEIGVPAELVKTAGNLKYDVRVPGESAVARELRRHLPKNGKIIVAGSTLQDEEGQLLRAFRELLPQFPELVLILAPRHPERFLVVEDVIKEMQLPYFRRSDWMQQPMAIAPGSVFVLDSMGELASVYSLASVAFVGGSLVQAGGHNPLEPAQYAVPIVMGPYTENFRGMVAVLLENDAIRVTPPERLCAVLRELLTSSTSTEMGIRARRVFNEHVGASEQCFDAIMNILERNGAPIQAARAR